MRIHTPRRAVVTTFVAALAVALPACGGGSNDTDQPTEENAMYCELIDPETIAPIVGDQAVKDFGSPSAKSPTRMINCNLYLPDEREESIAVFEFELGSASKRRAEQDKVAKKMPDLAARYPDHYEALEDGDDVGYAWYDGKTAAANLLTPERNITVTVPATSDQAGTYTPLMLKVAQEIDTNLDAWDEDNPA